MFFWWWWVMTKIWYIYIYVYILHIWYILCMIYWYVYIRMICSPELEVKEWILDTAELWSYLLQTTIFGIYAKCLVCIYIYICTKMCSDLFYYQVGSWMQPCFFLPFPERKPRIANENHDRKKTKTHSRDNWVYPWQCTHKYPLYRAYLGISHRGTL